MLIDERLSCEYRFVLGPGLDTVVKYSTVKTFSLTFAHPFAMALCGRNLIYLTEMTLIIPADIFYSRRDKIRSEDVLNT